VSRPSLRRRRSAYSASMVARYRLPNRQFTAVNCHRFWPRRSVHRRMLSGRSSFSWCRCLEHATDVSPALLIHARVDSGLERRTRDLPRTPHDQGTAAPLGDDRWHGPNCSGVDFSIPPPLLATHSYKIGLRDCISGVSLYVVPLCDGLVYRGKRGRHKGRS
jgi:hypothetical protein